MPEKKRENGGIELSNGNGKPNGNIGGGAFRDFSDDPDNEGRGPGEYRRYMGTYVKRKAVLIEIHVSVETSNTIATTPSNELTSMFKKEDGGRATNEEILEALQRDLQKGHKFFTGGCDNRRPDGRCAGHPVPRPEPEGN